MAIFILASFGFIGHSNSHLKMDKLMEENAWIKSVIFPILFTKKVVNYLEMCAKTWKILIFEVDSLGDWIYANILK